jgi:hypothetical protein
MHKLSETSPYSTGSHDEIGCIGLTPLQKYTAAVRQLAMSEMTVTIKTITLSLPSLPHLLTMSHFHRCPTS